ncbi:MAG: sugar ABC transporter substrate-binding protein [Clostridiaceae bacterium]|nr:sugar ABC transporter substrate-binding protein [Clostridiaceae bacterium]
MKKIICFMAVLVFGLCVMAGCGQSNAEEESADGVKMYMIVSTADTFRQNLMDAAEAKAEAMGAEITIKDAEGSLENQIAYIEEAVDQGYDVVLCNPVDVDTTLQLKLAAGDLPIVFWNSCPDEQYLEEDKYVFVGSNESDAGQFQAEYILDKFADQDTINVAIFEGQKLHSATLGRTNSLKAALDDSGKEINYVFDDYADWDTDIAKSQFELLLKTGQSVDVVACNNDSMALGVIQACEENGISFDDIVIVGVDATEEGCAAIVDGKMQFTAFQPAVGQGEYAVMAAARLAKGKSLEGLDYLDDNGKYVWVPFERVDSSNVADYQ